MGFASVIFMVGEYPAFFAVSSGEQRLTTPSSTVALEDRVHLRDLVSVGLVDESWLPGLSTPLRERLAHILSSPEG